MGVKVRQVGDKWVVRVDWHQHRKSKTFSSEDKARDFAGEIRDELEASNGKASDWVRRLISKANRLVPGEALDFVPLIPCVYFLMHRDRVVYVGRTSNLYLRIGNHLREKQGMFTGIQYIHCGQRESERLERRYIKKYNPPLNKTCKTFMDETENG
ncbi:MAG: GIY-YIG nuclease family protein [Anaerolineales bacterium]|nr:GIY-YIG nuclease family protein [Anaerolineales bacterium]